MRRGGRIWRDRDLLLYVWPKRSCGTDCSKNYGRPQNNGSWRRGQQDNGYNNRYARDLNCYKCGNQGHIAKRLSSSVIAE